MAHKWARWLHHPCRLGGIPTASERGAKSEVAHKWARWLHNPCRLGGSPPLQSGGHNQSGPSGQGGYITPAASEIPTASERGSKPEVAHKWASWLHNPCRLGGSPPLKSGGQNQKWPTGGQGGYIAPPTPGIPTASQPGAKSEVAHKWARWLHHPCRLGVSPPLQSEGQNQKWPTSGQGGYITPAAPGIPTASERGTKSEVAHKWARWLHNPCRLGDSHRFRARVKTRSGPQVGKLAT